MHACAHTQVRIDGYFGRMQDIIRKGKISAPIKFMLQDVMELRVNLWVPRGRKDQSLKTIDQVPLSRILTIWAVIQEYTE